MILRLVRRASDRAAIAAGQVDAVLDAGTGRAILLPEAQAALLEHKARYRSLVDLTSDGYWEQDEQFRFTMHSGMRIGGGPAGASDILGRQLWDLPFENGGQIDWQTHRTQLEWRAVFRDLALRFVDDAGQLRSISISGEPMFDAQARFKGYCGIVRDDTAADALVSHDDLTDARWAEQLLRLEYNVARSLAGAGGIAAGLQAVLRAVCELQRWDGGRYFRLDENTRELVLQESWGEPADAAQQLRAARAALAHEADPGGAFAFPVLDGKHALGALVFAGRAVHAADERLLQAVRSIGEQVGHFLQRRQADDAMRHNEALYRNLLDLSVDWWWEQDEQFRYTSLTGAGMACIKGMPGRTLWEVPGIIVDDDLEWIRHKSELAAQWSFCDLQCAVARPDGRMDYYLISGAPVYNAAGVFTGFHGTGLDISHGRRTEIAARDADAKSAGS